MGSGDGAVVRGRTCLSPMWPEFKSWTLHYVMFGLSLLLFLFLAPAVLWVLFLPHIKANISKFQFD